MVCYIPYVALLGQLEIKDKIGLIIDYGYII